jgi:isopentenyldiphosphate isomerase
MEVESFRWIEVSALKDEINTQPENFTVWFKEIMMRV